MYKKLFLFIILISCNQLLYAESISGIVLDESDPVPMAEVMLVNADSNVLISSTVTNNNGGYRFIVKPGIYKLRLFKEDYASKWVENVSVSGEDVVRNIEITPAAFVSEQPAEASDDCE